MADISIANTTSGLSGKTVLIADGDQTVTGLHTFDRDPSAPFAVSASSAVVSNLDADKVDGQHGPFAITGAQTFTGAQQFPAGTNALPSVAVNDTDVGMYSSGTNALDFATNGVKALGIDATQFIDSPTQPRVSCTHNTTQSLTNATETAVLFNTEDFDVGGLHDTASNSSRITIPAGGDGLYLITGTAVFDVNATGNRYVYLQKNGTTKVSSLVGGLPNPSTFSGCTVMALVSLAAADYVELFAYQSSGGALTIGTAARYTSNQFQAVKLW